MQCRDKVKYFTKEYAESALWHKKKSSAKNRNSFYGVRIYKCHMCGYYHFGHRPSLEKLEMIRLHSNPSVLEWKKIIMRAILQEQYRIDAGNILTKLAGE